MPEMHPNSLPDQRLMQVLAHIAQAELLTRRLVWEASGVQNRAALRLLIAGLRSIRDLIRYLAEAEVMI